MMIATATRRQRLRLQIQELAINHDAFDFINYFHCERLLHGIAQQRRNL